MHPQPIVSMEIRITRWPAQLKGRGPKYGRHYSEGQLPGRTTGPDQPNLRSIASLARRSTDHAHSHDAVLGTS